MALNVVFLRMIRSALKTGRNTSIAISISSESDQVFMITAILKDRYCIVLNPFTSICLGRNTRDPSILSPIPTVHPYPK
jgi:hypothetical protein